MAYTKEGIMAQLLVAFGQGTDALHVSQDAALELRRWYYDAITDEIVEKWDFWAADVLLRMRAIGSLAALKAVQTGSIKITARMVYEAALIVQKTSETPICPDPPLPLV
ncbi:MAG TPA: hypothetical protein VH394_29190 [Thermoanaerobaculia bacterium]|nr:hypothetical protein [Thermoanaerobaculia bacterium]